MAGRAMIEILIKVLDDLTCEIIQSKFEQKNLSFLDNTRGEWLESFDKEDKIYKEFGSSEENELFFIQDQDSVLDYQEPLIPKPRTWRENRPRFRTTVYNVFKCALSIMFIGTVIGIVGTGALYLTWQTYHFCPTYPWKELSSKMKWVSKGSELLVVLILHFWGVINFTFIFGWNSVRRTWVWKIAYSAFVLDVIYRITLLLSGLDKTVNLKTNLKIPLNILVATSYLLQCFYISGLSFHTMKKRIHLMTKLALPPFFAGVIICVGFYEIYPLYNNTESTWVKFFIATLSPLVGSVVKSFARIIVQRLHYVNHPGTSFVLLVYPYLVSALIFRILQADLEDPAFIALVGIVHGLVEILERSTIIIRDHLDNQIYERRLAPVGAFRTPRSERLTADIALVSMIFETASVVVTNGCILLYTFLYEKEKIDSFFYQRFTFVIVIQVVIEWICTSISLAIETHFQNMAVLSIWRKKKCLHIAVAAINILCFTVYGSQYLRTGVNNTEYLNCTYMFSNEFLPHPNK